MPDPPPMTAEPFAAELAVLSALDPALLPVIEAVGPLPARTGDPGFAGLASTIVSQLVSRQSADAIWARLIERTGPLTPEAFLHHGRGEGPRLGLTAAKADTLVRIAYAVVSGSLDLPSLTQLDAAEATRRLVAIKGVGPWTAEVHLLFNAGHPDIFPAGDLALRAAYAHLTGLAERPSIAELQREALRWSPHRSVAARLLWAYYGRHVRPGPAILP